MRISAHNELKVYTIQRAPYACNIRILPFKLLPIADHHFTVQCIEVESLLDGTSNYRREGGWIEA